MNLGGASNVDLTEAARLLKQSAVAGAPNQQVPPPMMLMQQAVAMQQFQFQQALLMQQVMATQQAAARAATVKSAQEMAAARAAEISKQLKGNEPEVEGQEKKSPGRSLSRTPSRSRSRSISRSKSRSPLRYRRDRSASRSPIRYRRDPVSREYFGHRGRSRRGYYRGRGEYAAWNPSYRRERDHYSSRSRRSRSRSRSRGRSRRSHSRSRSPRRPRRDRSGTPLRYRSSRRSRSVGGRPTPSRSRSRSRSESLHPERDGKVRSDTKEETRPKSISPARSLSVSLSPPPRKNVEGALKPNDWKKAMMREALVQKITESNGGEGSPEQEIDTKGAFRSKGGDFVAKREEFSSDESDGNKDVDDWRDDIKVNELEKMKRKESKREMERREEERRAQVPVHVVVPEEAKGPVMTLLEHLGRGTGKLSVESPFTAFKVPVEPETGVNGSMGLSVQEEIILDRVSTGKDEEAGDVTHGSADEESDVVFEGPLPPEEEEVGKRSPDSSKGEESGEEIGVEEPPSVAEQEVKGKGKSKSRGDEGARGLRAGKDRSKLKEDDEHRKSKAKSRSRERSRSKRHEDETDHERRKDKHRRHRRRRRRDEESEKEEDDEDETGDADSSKEREERRRRRSRRHRKEDKREKKRRRHKHRRGKSPSESPEKELLVLEAEGEGVHKKQSSGRESRRKEASKFPAHASESGSD